jgi:aspartyl protease family protein
MTPIYTITLLCISLFFSGCSGCSQSGRRNIGFSAKRNQNNQEAIKPIGSKTVVRMEKINGVYEIPTEIDGVPMHFIFDTGAGLISISETEAIFLYKQGKIDKNDIVGKANFIDANGGVSEGTIINLKTVKLGDRILKNVQASVVHNLDAPLLMGQSALEQFGKISIDYNNSIVIFE